MKTAFHAGVSGLMAYQQAMDTIGNNIANVNTVGYKNQTSDFADLLYVHMDTKSEPELLRGVGTKVAATQLHAGQASLLNTGGDLDFAVLGDGFFLIENQGEKQYTRNGTFAIGTRSSRAYLTTTDGSYVLDLRGRKIELKADKDTGQYDLTGLKDEIGVYRFANPHVLMPLSANRYGETEASGKATRDSKGVCKVLAGSLEASATDLSDEMSAMIRAQRAFQASARVVTAADQIEDIVNGLRR